jgi:AcrR family transcriptional regulator
MPAAQNQPVAELFGLPPPARTGRDRLIATAIDLFYRHGFQSVGLDRILAEAGVTKTTFYKHFDSREDLVLAAVQTRDQWEREAWTRAVKLLAGDDPKKQLLAVFDVLDRWFNDPAFGGCIFINTTAEFPDPRDPVHRAAAEHKRRNRDEYVDLARQAGLHRPEAFADGYTALLEGALILRQTHGRNDAARTVRPFVEMLIAAHSTPGTSDVSVAAGAGR